MNATVPSSNNKKIQIGRASLDRITFRQAVEQILGWASQRESHYIVTPNADHVLQLESDPVLRDVYRGASLVTCDGKPVLWASHLLGTPLPQAVTGADLLPGLCKYGASSGLRVALLGGPPGTAETAGQRLEAAYPGLQVVWTYCPPLGFDSDAKESALIVKQVHDANVDILFVGVGAPKQEKWMFAHKAMIKTGVMLGIGAAIEFTAGSLPRAPKWMRTLGLEWAFRLAHDPRRLAVRYARDLKFFGIVGRQFVAQWLQRKTDYHKNQAS
jgi:N-acetylglucosaminyldiphosphoundecaprenol N-acetyl-beta-D-mannosaminyltransferase